VKRKKKQRAPPTGNERSGLKTQCPERGVFEGGEEGSGGVQEGRPGLGDAECKKKRRGGKVRRRKHQKRKLVV